MVRFPLIMCLANLTDCGKPELLLALAREGIIEALSSTLSTDTFWPIVDRALEGLERIIEYGSNYYNTRDGMPLINATAVRTGLH